MGCGMWITLVFGIVVASIVILHIALESSK